MKLKDITKEELESMSYDDIAYIILKEGNKKLKLPDLFKKICKLLDLDEAEYEAKISDFFQLISRDQRFKMLDKGYWDLKEKYQTQVIITSEDEDIEEIEASEEDDELDTEEENDNYFVEENEDDDPEEDDLKDLIIITDEEEDEANLS